MLSGKQQKDLKISSGLLHILMRPLLIGMETDKPTNYFIQGICVHDESAQI